MATRTPYPLDHTQGSALEASMVTGTGIIKAHAHLHPTTRLPRKDVSWEGVETVRGAATALVLPARQRVAVTTPRVAVLVVIFVVHATGAVHGGSTVHGAHRWLALLPLIVVIAKVCPAGF